MCQNGCAKKNNHANNSSSQKCAKMVVQKKNNHANNRPKNTIVKHIMAMDHQLTLRRARRRVGHDRVDVGVVGGVGVGNEQCFRNQIGHVQFVNDVGQDLSVGAGAFVFFRNSQCNRYNLAKSVKNRQKILQNEENRKQFTLCRHAGQITFKGGFAVHPEICDGIDLVQCLETLLEQRHP